ncbi:hypothetical protein LUZ60_010528 [Juncus effusus]|nr:hypothetical protein LUZ60_010528 [Juncus effusus]
MASPSSSSSSRIRREWSDLPYDLLVSIFSRIDRTYLIAAVSCVCSSWRSAARNPNCWRILDLCDWEWGPITTRFGEHATFNQVFRIVLAFVSDSERIEEVNFPSDADGQDLILVADRLPNLVYFEFPNAEVPEIEFCTALSKFRSLKGIACVPKFMTGQVLSILGTKFPDFSELVLLDGEIILDNLRAVCISLFIPKLRKLEICNTETISTTTVLILAHLLKCLECLDISGCNELTIGAARAIEKVSRLKKFIW